jgi:hypothetical protein
MAFKLDPCPPCDGMTAKILRWLLNPYLARGRFFPPKNGLDGRAGVFG